MIRNLSELLSEIKSKGLDKIIREEENIKHRPTIGNIFEGLTKEILELSIAPGIDLQVVNNSFIYDDNGKLSEEIDCMIVCGEGLKILYTNQYKYHLSNVIAVIQVKKNLFSKDINSAHWNLRTVNKMGTTETRFNNYIFDLHVKSYEILTGKEFPTRDKVRELSLIDKNMYYLLMMEACFPLKIVISYYGFKNELNLRTGFANELGKVSNQGGVEGYGPASFPHLIICGENSIVKNNGMPISTPFKYNEEFFWPVLLSSNRRAFNYLLELIWTRLIFKFKISTNIFNSGFEKEMVHPFISCRMHRTQNVNGWDYYYHDLTASELNKEFSDDD